MEPETTGELTLKLPKKNDANTLDDYRPNQGGEFFGNMVVETIVDDMKENPESYFNFGFTFNDFKAYLMKIMYCRAVRRFIERKRIQKIDEYNKENRGVFEGGLQRYDDRQQQ